MDIGGISSLSSLGQAAADRKSIADNFDSFLQLLTTQLRNQNPLEPLDTNEFTNQLVQFSTVEQNIKTNENLESLLQLSSANVASTAVSYIGKSVSADGVNAQLKGGKASWTFTLAESAQDTTITVKNANGTPVYTEKGKTQAGTHVVNWNGISTDGVKQPDGNYTVEIVAKDANGNTIEAKTASGGVVESVDLSGVDPVLKLVDGTTLPLSSVRYIGQD